MPHDSAAPFTIEETSTDTKNAKLWNVIIHDSNQHTFQYVFMMLKSIFGKNDQDAEWLTLEVHQMGLAIVATVAKERAEFLKMKVDAQGADAFMIMEGKKSSGAIGCSIEEAP